MKIIWLIYYAVTISLNVAGALIFPWALNITLTSILPIFLMALSIFQAAYFHGHRGKKDFNVNNASDLTEEEWEQLSLYMRNSYIIFIPLLAPFVLFFSMWLKILSLTLWFAAFSGGALYYRIRHGRDLKKRFEKEDRELEEQIKREEEGNWR